MRDRRSSQQMNLVRVRRNLRGQDKVREGSGFLSRFSDPNWSYFHSIVLLLIDPNEPKILM